VPRGLAPWIQFRALSLTARSGSVQCRAERLWLGHITEPLNQREPDMGSDHQPAATLARRLECFEMRQRVHAPLRRCGREEISSRDSLATAPAAQRALERVQNSARTIASGSSMPQSNASVPFEDR